MYCRILTAAWFTLAFVGPAYAQGEFRYGEDIVGKMKIVGPVYSDDRPGIGALGVFDMTGPMPTTDETYLNAATSAACAQFREEILDAARDTKDAQYSMITIQFRWSADGTEIAAGRETTDYVSDYQSEDCAPLE